jgi:hypothetical protein
MKGVPGHPVWFCPSQWDATPQTQTYQAFWIRKDWSWRSCGLRSGPLIRSTSCTAPVVSVRIMLQK